MILVAPKSKALAKTVLRALKQQAIWGPKGLYKLVYLLSMLSQKKAQYKMQKKCYEAFSADSAILDDRVSLLLYFLCILT